MQLRFVEEYIKDSTTLRGAAIRAGYALDSADNVGSALMKDPRVRELMKAALDQAIQRIGVTAELVVQELWKIGGANPGDNIIVSEDGDIDVDTRKIVGEVLVTTVSGNGKKVRSVTTKTIKTSDKLAALGQLATIMDLKPKEDKTAKVEISFADLVQRSIDITPNPNTPPEIEGIR